MSKIKEFCPSLHDLLFDPLKDDILGVRFMTSLVSSAVMCLVGLFFLFNKKLARHPYNLLAIACLL